MLTDTMARNAKGADKDYKLADSEGLHLYVTCTGHRSWRWKYRFAGKEKRIVFGSYPEMSLKEARDRRDEGNACCATIAIPPSRRSAGSWRRSCATRTRSRSSRANGILSMSIAGSPSTRTT